MSIHLFLGGRETCTINKVCKPIRVMSMIEFLFPNSSNFESTFAHFSYKFPRWVSFCPDRVSIRPEYHQQPLFFTQPSQTPFGNIYVHKTPPTPPQNTPFPGLILKVGQTNYCLGKVGKPFLERAKKNYGPTSWGDSVLIDTDG